MRKVFYAAIMFLCSGTLFAAEDLPAKPKSAKPATGTSWTAVSNHEWKPADMGDGHVKPGTALDFSGFVESGPAGKHGKVIASPGGGFAFEKKPLERVYFFGCSIEVDQSLSGRSKEELDDFAERIFRQGYNMVRPHFLDHFLMKDAKKDLEFNPENLDRFEYFVSCLKRRGIYLYVDAMTSWKGYTTGAPYSKEALANSFKLRCYVEESARKHWLEGVSKLLTRVNPYTSTKLIDDPMVAVVLLYNEQNLRLDRKPLPPIMENSWREFIAGKYKTIEALRNAWVDEQGRSLLDQSVTLDTIPAPAAATFEEKNPRGVDYQSYIAAMNTDMTRWFIKQIRTMGYSGLVSHIDFLQYLRDAPARNEVDVISMHGYHAYSTDWDRPGSATPQNSSLTDGLDWWRNMTCPRFLDRPFVITEACHRYPNRYRYEQGIVMGGYGAFQDYDMLMFHYAPVRSDSTPKIIHPTTIGNDPVMRAAQVVAGLVFMRHDVSPAAHSVQLEIRPEDLLNPDNAAGALSKQQSLILLVTRFGISYSGSKPPAGATNFKGDVTLRLSGAARVITTTGTVSLTAGASSVADSPAGKFNTGNFITGLKEKGLLPASNLTDTAKGVYETENGQLLLNTKKHTLTMKTPRAEGVCDESFQSPHNLGSLTVLSSSKPAQIAALSLDGKPLADSSRILLVYATDALNSGATFDKNDRVTVRDKGAMPVLMQCGVFSIALKNQKAAAMNVWPLNLDGTRREKITTPEVSNGSLTLKIDTASLAGGPTPFFEIAVK